LVALLSVVFLAYKEKEGWGWILLLMFLCGVPSPNGDITDLNGRMNSLERRLEQRVMEAEDRVEKIDKIVSEKKPVKPADDKW
jgi:hypothetical protein